MQTAAGVHRFEDLPLDHPASGAVRRRAIGEHCMVSHLVLEQGFVVPSHAHENEQMSVILEGRLRFELGEPGSADHRFVEAGPGEVVVLPPNLPHGAEVLQRAVAIDIFSPPSESTGIDARAD